MLTFDIHFSAVTDADTAFCLQVSNILLPLGGRPRRQSTAPTPTETPATPPPESPAKEHAVTQPQTGKGVII